MNSSTLLLGLLPLIVFVVLDTFLSVKKALVFALILALLEAVYTIYKFGELDLVTGFSFLLLAILGGASFYKEDSIYFKFQPVILSIFMGAYFVYTFLVEEPIFVLMVTKYSNIIPEEHRLLYQHPNTQLVLKNASFTSGIGLLAHGVVTGFAAKKLSNFWWLVCRGVGFYIFLFISFLAARFI